MIPRLAHPAPDGSQVIRCRRLGHTEWRAIRADGVLVATAPSLRYAAYQLGWPAELVERTEAVERATPSLPEYEPPPPPAPRPLGGSSHKAPSEVAYRSPEAQRRLDVAALADSLVARGIEGDDAVDAMRAAFSCSIKRARQWLRTARNRAERLGKAAA